MRVEEILEEVHEEFQFLKDQRLDQFAEVLHQREQDKLECSIVKRGTDRTSTVVPLTIYPQFTCDWFMEGLDFVGPGWRHVFKRPITPPPRK